MEREESSTIMIMPIHYNKLAMIRLIILLALFFPSTYAFSIGSVDIIDLSQRCKDCHEAIYNEWSSSMHAMAAHDPWVVSMYNGSDIAGLSLGPSYRGSFSKSPGNCATCHAPDYAIEDPLNTDLNKVQNSMGVSCLFCHFVKRIDVHRDGKLSGVQSIGLKNSSQIRKDGDGCLIPSSSLVKKGIICASCHHGKYYDTLVYPSYDEWSKCRSKKTCQECHFKGNGHQLKIDKSFLSQSVNLEIKAWSINRNLLVKAAVTNTGAGHFYPTGHPIRNVILIIEVRDQDGKAIELVEGDTVPLYGGSPSADNAIGKYSGLPGNGFARVFEKVNPISCFNTSVPGANTLIGQSISLEKETRRLFPQEFWKRTMVLEDSRLPPLGTYNQVFRFQLEQGMSGATLRAKLIYRKAFEPLAQYYGWNMKDIVLKDISREIQMENREGEP